MHRVAQKPRKTKIFSIVSLRAFGGFGLGIPFFFTSLSFGLVLLLEAYRFLFCWRSFFVICFHLCVVVLLFDSVVRFVWISSWFDQETNKITENPSQCFVFGVLLPSVDLVTRKEAKHQKTRPKQKKTSKRCRLMIDLFWEGFASWSMFYPLLHCCLWSTHLFCFCFWLFSFSVQFFGCVFVLTSFCWLNTT